MLFIINKKYVAINRYDFVNDKEYYSKLMQLIKQNNKQNNNYINGNNTKINTLTNIDNLINCK
tara:strand:- start:26 stop:214 length:189 start_codon:yes stop_codon:yes gene_type:complete